MSEKSISKNIIYNIIYTGSNVVLPLVSSMYIARILGPEGTGKVFYAQNIVSYFVVFGSIGLSSYGVREIAKVRENQEKTNKCFSELIILQLAATTIASIIYLSLFLLSPTMRIEKELFLCAGIQLFMNVFNVDWVYQGREDYRYITFRSIIVKLISLSAIFIFVRTKTDYIVYSLLSSLSLVLNFLFNCYHIRKFVSPTIRNLSFHRHYKPLLTFTLVIFLSTIYSKIDITMLGVLSTKQAIGYYSYAQKIINTVLSICTAATAVFLPRLSWYYNNKKKDFIVLIEKGISALLFLVVPMAVGIFAIAPSAIELLFGKGFIESAITLRIFVPIIIIKSFGDLLCYQIVIATGNERKNIIASIIGSIVNVSLNAALIPVFNEKGAAIASVMAEFLLNLYLFTWSKKTLTYNIPHRALVQSVSSSCIMGCIIFVINRNIKNLFLNVTCCIGVGIIIYFVINFIFKNRFLFEYSSKLKSKLKFIRS